MCSNLTWSPVNPDLQKGSELMSRHDGRKFRAVGKILKSQVQLGVSQSFSGVFSGAVKSFSFLIGHLASCPALLFTS